jgi:hypothetical protein
MSSTLGIESARMLLAGQQVDVPACDQRLHRGHAVSALTWAFGLL